MIRVYWNIGIYLGGPTRFLVVLSGDGSVEGLIGTNLDISERKQAQLQLELHALHVNHNLHEAGVVHAAPPGHAAGRLNHNHRCRPPSSVAQAASALTGLTAAPA